MPRARAFKAPSRMNMRQIAAYVPPELALAAYNKATAEKKTNQEIVAAAISVALSGLGHESPLESEQKRFIRRSAATRAERKTIWQTTRTRVGSVFIGGWFPQDSVRRLREIAKSAGMSVQEIVITGLKTLGAENNAGMA